jgi:hypothetical protein
MCQPTKKAFRGGQASLATTALSTSTSASPARISIYTNKRFALASPAKGMISIFKNVKKAPQWLRSPLGASDKGQREHQPCRKNGIQPLIGQTGSSLENRERILEVTYGSS